MNEKIMEIISKSTNMDFENSKLVIGLDKIVLDKESIIGLIKKYEQKKDP